MSNLKFRSQLQNESVFQKVMEKILIPTAMIFMLCLLGSKLSAQYTILYNDASANPLPTDDVSVCQSEVFVNTARIVISSNAADNSTITITLPPGVKYVPGCMQVIATNAGITVSELDISDLGAPVFSINPADLSAADQFTIEYCRVADCDATAYQMGGGIFKDEIEVCGDDGCVIEDNPNVNSYDLLTPSLSMASDGPIIAAIGDNVCRNVTLTNGGLGYLDSIKYYIVDGPGTNTTAVTTPLGTVLTPIVNGDTLCYWLDAAIIAEFGNNDDFLDNGEQIMLERCYDVTACDNDSYYGATWGCPGVCMSAGEITQQTTIPNLVPDLSFGFETGVNRDYCFKGQNSATGGAAVIQRFELCNTGGGAATNISFELHNNTPGSGTGQNYFTLEAGEIFDAAGGSLGTTSSQTSLYTGNYYQTDCSLETHPRAVEYELGGIVVEPGECIYVEIPSYANNITQECDAECNANIAWYYFNRTYSYQDACAINNYGKARAGIAYGGRQLYRYTVDMPTDMRDCDEFNLEVNYSNFYNNTKSTTEGSTEMKIDVSNTGLLYNGTGTETFKGINITVTQTGDTICVIYPHNAIPVGAGQLALPLKATCSSGGGTKSLRMWHEGQYDDNCEGSTYHLQCLSRTFVMHCPEPCPEGGATPKLFTLERISLGLEDLDNNGVPDGTGTADPADVELHRASNCDTLKGTWEIFVHGNTVGPNAGVPFNHLYVEYDLNDLNLDCTYFETDNLFEPLPDAVATIFPADGSPSYTCTVTPTIEDTPGAGIDDLAKYDLSACKANWVDGDSIVFCALYKVTTSFHSSSFNQYVADNEVYSSYTPNPTGVNPSPENKYTCDHYNDFMNVYRHYYSPYTPTPQTVNGCNGTLNYYLRYYINTQTGDVWYPNEYRPFSIPDKFIIELDDALAFRPGSVRFAGQVVPDADITHAGGILTVCNLKQFFQGYGGPLLESDETWSYNLNLKLDPTCEAEPGLYNTRFTSQVIGNGCHSPDMNYEAVKNCTANGNSGLAQIMYDGPQPFLTGGGTIQFSSSTGCWDVILNNGSNNIDAPFSWFYIDGGINHVVEDAAGNPIVPDANGFYQLGDNPQSSSEEYTVCAASSECDTVRINVLSGFGCTAYPSDIGDLSCADTVQLIGLPLMSEVQLAFETQPIVPMQLCETQSFGLKMTSAQAAYLNDPRLSMLIPNGTTISNIQVEYPCGSGNIEAASFSQSGNLLIIDVEAHSEMTSEGMPGTIDALAPTDREACITFDMVTDCDFISSSGILFQAFGKRPCGDPAINNGIRVRSQDLTIDGVNQPHGASVSISSTATTLSSCEKANDVEVNIDIVSLGSNMTSASDSVYLTLDPGVVFDPASVVCCSANPAHCLTYAYSNTDAAGFTTVVLAFPATPIDITNPANLCFSYQVSATYDLECDIDVAMNVQVRASAGDVVCTFAAGGMCENVQTLTGEKDIILTTEKIEVNLDGNPTFECTSTGAINYSIPLTIDSLELEAGEFIVVDIHCVTASATMGAYVQSEVINGPVAAGTSVTISGTVPTGSCNPEYGVMAVVANPNNDGVNQCICEPLMVSSGALECPPDINHSKAFTSITETAPGEYDAKWTITVTNNGIGDGSYNLIDIPGFDDDIEICGAEYTSDAVGSPANPGPLLLAIADTFKLAQDQMIAGNAEHSYCLIVHVKYDPAADPAVGDGTYTACEDGTIGDPISGEGLYNQSQLDTDDDGVADEIDEVCEDLPCALTIVSAVPGVCNPATSTYDLTVSVAYGAAPDCLINIAGTTFVIDGSGSETFIVTGLTADGMAGTTVSAFFTCEASCFDQETYDAPAACSPLTCTTTQVNILCNGDNTGSATVTAAGGFSPYTYSWDTAPAQTTATATGLIAGSYSVTVTDASDNESICSVTITEPTDLVCTVTKNSDISCNGLDDGIATVNPAGGVGPYTYAWTGGETTIQATSLAGGVNTVTVTDANGCTTTCTVTIVDPPVLSCSITGFTNPTCATTATGSITISGTGGTGALQYSIDGGAFQIGTTFNNVSAGAHTITVQDANGCTSTCSQTLTDPAALTCTTVQNSPASCGMSNGAATVTPVGGTAGYTYLWDNTETTAQATALDAGTHTVTVTDANDCTTTCQVVITTTSGLECEITASSDVSCAGEADGSATVTATGGTAPYTYLWSNTQTTAAITNLSGGTYGVTITDNTGCTTTCEVIIAEATALQCVVTKNNDISCNGLSDGGATVSASGGTPGYTYLWTGGETTPEATALGAGTNFVTITDADGCTTICQVDIIEPAAVSCSIDAFTNLDCNGDDSGTITVSGNGGTGTLEYSVDAGAFQLGGTFTGLSAGAHTITVRDANGCTSTCSQSLTEPTVVTCSAAQNSPASCGMSNGVATVTPTGGTPGYTYLWDNTETTAQATALDAGTHTVTVTDANGCITTCQVVVSSASGLECEITASSDVSCAGEADGSATVTATGGTAPYTYLWSNAETTAAITNLSGGTFVVTITDNTGCTTTCEVTIAEATPLQCVVTKNNDISCNGLTDGGATVSASGGTPGYTYLWTGGETTPEANALAAGTNFVTITDADGCATICQVDIIEPAALSCAIDAFTNLDCNGDNSGTITASGSGGTGDLEFSVDGGVYQTSGTFTGLSAGTHTITVRDANGCQSNCSQALTEPLQLTCVAVAEEPTACGMDIGQATVTPDGGTSDYTYLWDNLETTATAVALSAGTHTVTVTDMNDCTTTCQVVISSTSGLSCEITASSDVTCNGASDGSATVEASGGAAPYTYAWDNGDATAAITGLAGGTYNVTITDATNCTTTCTVTIAEATDLLCGALKNSDVTCNGINDGSAGVEASGGTPGYTYLWTGGATTSVANNLAAGTNFVTVTDADGCTVVCDVVILEPPLLECSVDDFSNLECYEDNSGTITISATGGISPLEYSVDGGAFQLSGEFTGLDASIHTVIVRDANGCTTTCVQPLSQPNELTCMAFADEPTACGLDNGQASVIPNGGIPGYTYVWDNLETTPTAVALSAGAHTVTVTDTNGCTTSCSVVISSTSGLACDIISSTDVSCFEAADGTAEVSASGGTAPYTYAWSNGNITAAITGLSGGTYEVTVTDGDGCTTDCSVTILEATELICTIVKDNDISCNGLSDGGATVSASGGTPGYTYAWTGGETTISAIALGSGINFVTVTDADGCTSVCEVTIVDPPVLSCTITSFSDLLCNGDDSGTITVSGTGGTGDLEFSIDGGPYQSGGNFIGLDASMHSVTVRDANGCTSTCTQLLSQPDLLTCSVTADSPTACMMDSGEATVTPSGGTAGYTFLWDNLETTATATALSAGTHTVIVTDANNCSTSCQVIISSTSGLTCEIISSSDVSCADAEDGAAEVSATGGSAPYTYAWSDGTTTASISNLSGGTYNVIITDADGCSTDCSVTIAEATQLLCLMNKDNDISCNGLSDGGATISASGGTPGYTYLWTSGETSDKAIALGAGLNFVTVTDAAGCTTICEVNIVDPIAVSCTIDAFTDLLCNGDNSGTITVSGTGGIGTLEFSIDGGPYQIGGTFTGLDASVHTVTVRDANGCTSTCSQELMEPVVLSCTVVADSETACMMDSGSATVTPLGGTGPYTYLWDNLETTVQAVALSAGTHTVVVTDANNCETSCQVVITSTSSITCEITASENVSCNGEADGTATVEGTGGTAPYTYLWSDPSATTTATVSGLSGGNYSVTITDAEGCAAVCEVEITEATELLCSISNIVDISCFNESDGSAEVVASGGIPGYTYAWPSGETSATAVGLGVGLNTVTITDSDGCIKTCDVTIAMPDTLICSLTMTPSGCQGQDDGTITTAHTGGVAPFEYSINGGTNQTGNIFNDLAPGNYTVEVTDANGCITSCSIEVPVTGCLYDLSLIKTIAPGETGVYDPGDDVPFKITVCNQGQIEADSIEVTDYIPNGLVFNASNAINVANGWAGSAAGVETIISVAGGQLPVGGLVGNACYEVDLVLTVALNAPQGMSITNYAEISDDDGDDTDSTTDDDNTNDGPAEDDEVDGANGDQDDHDPAVININNFDLALTKSLANGQAANVAPGDNVTYTITVYNQGTIAADSIEVTDYISECMENADANWTASASDQVTYTLSVAGGELDPGGLAPDDFVQVDITLKIDDDADSSCDLTNWAEISDDQDSNGNSITDTDSTPDGNNTDTFGGDDETDGANGDEDDHDPAYVGLLDFDLALTKDLAIGQPSAVAPGDLVTYSITVINEGFVTTDSIEITDYIPACMSLSDSDWTAAGANATYLMTVADGDILAGGLQPGAMASIEITLMLDNPVGVSCDLTNVAEISSDKGEDTDSTPDNDDSNDPTGEDDIDDVPISLLDFDLALSKNLALGQASAIAPGDDITFTISVVNQGDINADSIEITDYLPSCTSLNDSDWTDLGTTATYVLTVADGDLDAGGLVPNGVASVDITLRLDDPVDPLCDMTNWAEISRATDEDGMPQEDEDSTPDNDDSNDPPGEDDIDDEPFTTLEFDLALSKDLAPGQPSAVAPGDLITYDITVVNEGFVTTDSIWITDYIPACMTLADPTWNLINGNATYLMTVAGGEIAPGGLLPGAMASVQITLILDNPVGATCDLTNVAEISGDKGDDTDSSPDDDDSNDPAGEDDIDNVPINLLEFDLALSKDLASGQSRAVAPGDDITFTISVVNQGEITADSIEVTDYLPDCTSLNDAGWTDLGATATYIMTAGNELPVGGLAPNQVASIDITLTLDNPFDEATCDMTNWAEISSATDEDGMPQVDIDSTPDNDEGNDPPGEDDIDDEPFELLEFDLSLSKNLAPGEPNSVAPGHDITFRISVVNQGDITADSIELTDYLPSCTSLNDSDWTDLGTTATYVMTAGVDLPVGGLAPNGVAFVDITLQLDNPLDGATCDMTNWAEISSATDENGMPQVDVDSTPDGDPSNDPPGEDDIDDEPFGVLEFDLALSKTLAIGQTSAVMPGDDVTFTFTVFNQGQVPADSIQITDYIPTDFALNDADWTGVNPASTMLTVGDSELPSGGLLPGQSVTVDITLTVLMSAVNGNTYINYGEISSATDDEGNPQEDIDSEPDMDPNNDPNGEDDVDNQPLTIMGMCDLSLIKKCGRFESNGDGTGGQIVFELIVTNQGGCTAYDIGLIDYTLPGQDMVLNDSDWFLSPFGGFPTYNIPGPLLPGEIDTVEITFDITTFDPDNPQVNYAEITGSYDFNGDEQDDDDSEPNTDPIDDGAPVDDEQNNAGRDEDDHDIQELCIIDLSIDKNLDPSMAPPYAYGDDIIFNICVTNEGNATVDSIVIADYIPAGFSFDPLLNAGWTGTSPTVYYGFAGPVEPGEVVCVDIVLEFTNGGGSTADYTNVTEITEVYDEDGDLEENDWDSTPDNDDGDQSEDDEDNEYFEIFDLELSKNTITPGPFAYGQDIEFNITVCNTGTIVAQNIVVEDRFPCGYEFVSSSGWTESGGTITTNVSGPLGIGVCVDVPVTIKLQACDAVDAWVNEAEIIDSEDDQGNPRDDTDSTEDNDDPAEDDQDTEVVDVFDLAQIKQVPAGEGPYLFGDIVEYVITVCNQGNLDAANITITDYLPAGLTFDPAYVHGSGSTPNANAAWTVSGSNVEQTILDGGSILAPGTCQELVIYLEVVPATMPEDWHNYSEISDATDGDGNEVDDADSTPDNDDSNDDNSTDDAFDNEGGDEDDHDGAEIIVGFDLALTKTSTEIGPFTYGQDIVFDITVHNQGGITAYNVPLVDYIPCGYDFVASSGWTYDAISSTATTTIAGPIAPGTSEDVQITLKLKPCADSDAWVNYSEITGGVDEFGVPGDDFDSTPDSDNTNDSGGTPGSNEDDHIDDDGTDGDGDGITDEDDHDPHRVDVFDLAQIKQVPAGPGPYLFGDIVEYVITVCNQGNVDAANITITDYLPSGLTFDPTYVHGSGTTPNANANWAQTGGNATQTIMTGGNVLLPGDCAELVIYLEVVQATVIEDWYNFSEISSATDGDGGPVGDADSTPDNDNSNDDNSTDDAFDSEGGDEDDHDGEEILVTGEIGDTVWKDLDGDGIQDDNEPGVGNVVVTLYDCNGVQIRQVTTDAAGNYLFDLVLPGDYQLNFDISGLPEGCAFTYAGLGAENEDSDADLNGNTTCITLEAGENNHDIDVGLLRLTAIGDYVWHDLNGDGTQDSNEPGLAGITVKLFKGDGTYIGSTTTDSNGNYLFDGLYPGDYYLEFVPPSQYPLTTLPNQGNDTEDDSDIDNSNGPNTTQITTLSADGTTDLSWDAGFYKCAPIGELVWYDIDMDNVVDDNENGINGLKIELYRKVNGTWQLYDSTVTGHKPGTPSDDGYFKFCAPPGEYHLKAKLPPYGLVAVLPNVGSDDTKDSDFDDSNGPATSETFFLISGQGKCDLAAGYHSQSSVGNLIWNDENKDGVRQTDEGLVPGVLVEAYDIYNDLVGSDITDEEGKYMIDNLRQEGYYLKVYPPKGYETAIANSGSDDEVDSDVDHTNGLNTTDYVMMTPGAHVAHVDIGLVTAEIAIFEIVDFGGRYRPDFVELKWGTIAEADVTYYQIEKRHETTEVFTVLGKQIAKGTDSRYNVNDYDIEEDGIYYYRLRTIDNDGIEQISDEISVDISSNRTDGVSVYPNPAISDVNVEIVLSVSKLVTIDIYDTQGKLIKASVYEGQMDKGITNTNIDVSNIPSGVYNVQIQLGSDILSKRIILLKN